MSNQGGDQAVWVTEGHEEEVARRYREIKDIIQENTSVPFKDAIKQIAGVAVGTWYNYISQGAQRGRVSKHTVKNLSAFFGLGESVFTGEAEFTNVHKERIAEWTRDRLTNESINTLDTLPLIEKIASIADEIDDIKDQSELETVISKLKKTLTIAQLRKDLLRSINEL
ncbi:hypothetical protein [Brevibacillus fortis]|uniref:hypothetical protein n=1 Tax=Brevibacillus fortis TaxID=2126352 RepID=UPI0038FC53C2